MRSITASCICSLDPNAGANRDNLLFSGQLLPERNGGLAGTPSTHADQPFVTGVFRGYGPDGSGAAAAHRAASALLQAGEDLAFGASLWERLSPLCAETLTETGEPTGCAGAAAVFSEERLHLFSCGGCRAYLFRDRALFLLSPAEEAQPYSLDGVPLAGDRLLLCTATLAEALSAQQILEQCAGARSDAAALQQLLKLARSQGAGDSVTAVLLRIE